jgi:phosphoribosylglycinamide formyltransferase-1
MNIAILASGAGSNAANIIEHFKNTSVHVSLVACNKAEAGVFQIAKDNEIDSFQLTKENFKNSDQFVNELQHRKIDLVILAGFLWLVPSNLVRAFEERIINIHPALLPKFGGKGMYGHFVHEAVYNAHEVESGITIHLVNEEFDKGKILFQAKENVENCSASEIEQKVRALEIEHFPKAIENFISKM